MLAALLIAALAMSAIAAGCGGSDDSSTADTTASNAAAGGEAGGNPGEGSEGKVSPAKVKFVNKAGAICTRRIEEAFEAQGAAVNKAVKGGASEAEAQAEAIHTAFLPKLQTEVEELNALTPPPGEEEEVEAVLDSLEGAVEEVEDTEYTASSVEEFGQEFSEADELGGEYGLTSCSL